MIVQYGYHQSSNIKVPFALPEETRTRITEAALAGSAASTITSINNTSNIVQTALTIATNNL